MTWFEYYTQSPERLEMLLYKAVDDALEAKGCSFDLMLPENLSEKRPCTWAEYLKEEMPYWEG